MNPETHGSHAIPPEIDNYRPRRLLKKTLFIITNIAGVLAIVAWIGLLLLARQPDSGADILALVLSPLLLFIPVTLLVDFIAGIKYLRRNHAPSRKHSTILIAVIILAVILAVGIFSTINDTWTQYQAERTLSLTESQSLIENCKVDSIARESGKTTLF